MIKKILFVTLPLAALFACNNNVPEKDASIMPEKSASATAPLTDTLAAQPSVNMLPANAQQPAVNATAPATQPITAGLNPAHGQPGHRCEIAVGAPLSSAPAQTTAPQMVQTPVSAPVSATPAKATSGGTARLNPAHGQPGHDCAVPVGQPLN